jgi:hypothetical protein
MCFRRQHARIIPTTVVLPIFVAFPTLRRTMKHPDAPQAGGACGRSQLFPQLIQLLSRRQRVFNAARLGKRFPNSAIGGLLAMAIRRRCFAPLVALVTAAYLISSIGCTTARVRPGSAVQPLRVQGAAADAPASNAVSYADAQREVAMASYHGDAHDGLLSPSSDVVASSQVDIDQIVRGQDDHGYGPIKEFLWSPYTIGVAFIAAIVIPAAFKGADDDL